jgi:hypothetical protein
MENQSVRICPACNSTDISYDFSNAAMVSLGMTNNAFVCNHCGNQGSFFPEIEKDKVPQLKMPEKRQLVNKPVGSNINWWWRISGPVILLIGVILLLAKVPYLFYLSLIDVLPFGLIITINSYSEKIRKNKIFKVIFLLILVYAVFVAPFLALYLFDSGV